MASYGGDSGEESDGGGATDEDAFDEASLTDWTKMACLLCKRQFSTKEMLMKHQNMSDLHKVWLLTCTQYDSLLAQGMAPYLHKV